MSMSEQRFDLLQRLHNLELQRKAETETALSRVESNLDASKRRRFVSGIALSTNYKIGGFALEACGVEAALPVPLYFNHDWLHVLGKVTEITAYGAELHFKAELCNSGRLAHVEQLWWEEIATGNVAKASVLHTTDLAAPDGKLKRWGLREVSLVQVGMDPNARVCKVWETAPRGVVYLDRPSEFVIWSAP